MELDSIAEIVDAKEKQDQYRGVLAAAVASGDAAACRRFVDHGAGLAGSARCCRVLQGEAAVRGSPRRPP